MNSAASRLEHLYQAWVHVHEEDLPEALVLRPEQHARPAPGGRGGDLLRTRIAFQEDGSCRVSGVGSADRPAASPGRFRVLDRDPLTIELRVADDPLVLLEVAALEADRLLIRKV